MGLERTGGFETVAFCEIEEFPRRVLAKHWPDVPCFHDVRELKGSDVGTVDVICGGYPCQPFSSAGKRLGAEDDRHLWPEYSRLIDELRPTWVIGENVVGHVSMGLDDVLFDLETLGYSARTFIIPACAVDAKHRRSRTWIVAHTASTRQSGQGEFIKSLHSTSATDGQAIDVINGGFRCQWEPEPYVDRVAHGIPLKLDRLKALGNAVVPQIPELIGHAILQAERQAA